MCISTCLCFTFYCRFWKMVSVFVEMVTLNTLAPVKSVLVSPRYHLTISHS